ncbi:sulfotransferase domain-containing protein [Pseudodesulfovibrio pelocollis]|uniref:sulfotransferase domain-containing protein n=1 Tax=Pseudodesulfovibrio pelocollis TaxID=3051432 RepID=UPI00255AC202|nr:sulfotransferase domain-containing protein [Pseudodesulfovibrio sp. SB368]
MTALGNRATSERWPDFIIAGAAKSGSTSLFHYLKAHPGVFMPDEKEPSFFSTSELCGYHDQEQYLNMFRDAQPGEVAGEASVVYLMDPDSARRIHDMLGDSVKLIMVLRNPVDVMYSHWGHRYRDGIEHREAEVALLESFKEMEWNPQRWHFQHALRAQYYEQLKRYYDLFDPERMKVYIFEEFFSDGLPLFSDLCLFLGIDDSYKPEGVAYNRSYLVRSLFLQRFVNVYYRKYFLNWAKFIFTESVRNKCKNALETWNSSGRDKRPIPAIAGDLRSRLEDRLSPGVRKLENLLGRELSGVWF